MVLWGTGKPKREFLFVDDLADAVVFLMNSISFKEIGELINIGTGSDLSIKAIIHDAEEGVYWAEVPSIPGCATQGKTMDELMQNIHDAIEGCLSIENGSLQN